MIEAAGLDRNSVRVVLLNDPEINAFVAQGQVVYIHSGLLAAADNANEIQGVIAHRLGHVTGGHAIRTGEGIKQATAITILSLVLGAAAMAVGAGDAGVGILAAGQQAALGTFLAFSLPRRRVPISQAPPTCPRLVSAAGAASNSSRSCRTRSIASRSMPRTATTAPPAFQRTHPGAEPGRRAARRARNQALRRQGPRFHGLDLLRRPAGLLIELASYRFEPPFGYTHSDVLLEAHKLRVERGDYNIGEEHLADAIELLVLRSRPSLSDDRSPKDPYSTRSAMAAITLNILKPSVNNLTVRIFVRAAGLDFEEVDVWGKTREPEFLGRTPRTSRR